VPRQLPKGSVHPWQSLLVGGEAFARALPDLLLLLLLLVPPAGLLCLKLTACVCALQCDGPRGHVVAAGADAVPVIREWERDTHLLRLCCCWGLP
jgi:hypothetical protein